VIASTADPSLNLLDIGTLSYSDLKNQASYSAMSAGISVSSGSGGTSASPSIGVPQFGDTSSTTRAGIAQGTIITRDNPGTDLSGLDRAPDIDAAGLKSIFDQQKVAEQRELGNVAGQVGMRAAGDIASYEANHATTEEEQKSWQDGGANKVLMRAFSVSWVQLRQRWAAATDCRVRWARPPAKGLAARCRTTSSSTASCPPIRCSRR
jgi:filamentous hemagglutinin